MLVFVRFLIIIGESTNSSSDDYNNSGGQENDLAPMGALLYFGGSIASIFTLVSASNSAREALYLYNEDLKKDLEIQEIMQGTQ